MQEDLEALKELKELWRRDPRRGRGAGLLGTVPAGLPPGGPVDASDAVTAVRGL